ncbi:transposase [Streptomyces europaeiscabiei]|uniref:transposase n=1 Tax=Streptomyces europaeiscabiei TaxID=146819 RepID=UPI002E18E674|nr:transposase [Streptomyces europaeiscabiei]
MDRTRDPSGGAHSPSRRVRDPTGRAGCEGIIGPRVASHTPGRGPLWAAGGSVADGGHTGYVLAQGQVADKSNEIPAFRPLLDSVDLTGTVITADALHTQHAHGTYLRKHGAHHIAQVKANHPVSSTASATCPGARSRSTTTTAPGPTTAWRSDG